MRNIRHCFPRPVFATLVAIVLASAASAQLARRFPLPPANDCCIIFSAQRLARDLGDWPQLGRYHADDVRVEQLPAQVGRVVFLGDSITDIWNLPRYFPGKPYINRGISGQTTAQMVLRMFPDVIDLHPRAVVLLAGTNDIAQNTGPVTLRMIAENVEAMTELAHRHHIHVIFCSLLPVSDYTRTPQTSNRPPADILALNQWLRSYARAQHEIYCDYYAAVVDAKGMFTAGLSGDGLHPDAQGFARLAPVAQHCIDEALALPPR